MSSFPVQFEHTTVELQHECVLQLVKVRKPLAEGENVCMWSKMKQYEMENTLWFCIISSMTLEGTYERLVKVIWEDAA